jgi:hypothetical protein
LTEKTGGREKIHKALAVRIRSHYDSLKSIADDVETLGYKGAAAILRERLPRGKTARSGDLGEILASELVEERLGFNVPVRRMRFKGGREVALRGDDFIGIAYDPDDNLWLLKGESKSRRSLARDTIEEARTALNRDNGRCTPLSLLLSPTGCLTAAAMMRSLVAPSEKALPRSRIDHALFTLSGNTPPKALAEDYNALGQERIQHVINLRIEDHPEFISMIFEEAAKVGDD